MLYVLGRGHDGMTKRGNYIDSTVLLEFHFSAVRTSKHSYQFRPYFHSNTINFTRGQGLFFLSVVNYAKSL